MSTPLHPLAPHDLPPFITAPGQTDVLFVVTASIVIGMILLVGVMFFWLHSLPERVAHKSKKFQFEIVAILGLLSLFTHQHIFWVAGLLLAFIELPNFSHPLRSMAHSLEKLAGESKPDFSKPDVPKPDLLKPDLSPAELRREEPSAPDIVAGKPEVTHA